MADIRTIGIQFDPKPAKAGADAAKKAVRDMADSVGKDLKKVEADGKKTGDAVKAAGGKIEVAAKGADNAVEKLGRGKGFQRMADGARTSAGQVSNGIIDMLDTFGLLDSRMGMMVRRVQSGINSVGNLSRMWRSARPAMAGGGAAAAGAGQAMAGLGGAALAAASGILKFSLVAVPIVGTLAAIVTAAGVLAAGLWVLSKAWDAVAASIGPAAKMEGFEIKLAVSMGSFDKAREKIVELKKFANETPFSDSEVFGAGVKLQTMTKGALSTAEALKAIGGSAYQSGKSFDEVADLSGRAFQAIKLGMDFIEPLKTMNSYGMISGDTLKTVVALGAATKGASTEAEKAAIATKQWAAVFADLKQNSVALVLASKTWEGLMSTLEGNWEALKAAFGAPIIDALKPALTELIGMFPFLIEQAGRMGEVLANGIKFLYQSIKDGELDKFLALTLDIGIAKGVSNFLEYFRRQFPEVSKMLTEGLTVAAAAAKLAFVEVAVAVIKITADLLTSALKMAFNAAIYVLTAGMVDGFDKSTTGFEDKGKTAAQNIADTLRTALSDAFKKAAEDFGNFMEQKIKAISPLANIVAPIMEKAGYLHGMLTDDSRPKMPTKAPDPAFQPTVGLAELEAWIKDPTVELTGVPDGMVLPPKPTTPPPFVGPPDGRTELQKMMDEKLSAFERENPGFSNSDLGTLRPPNPTPDPSGDLVNQGGGGKGASAEAPPKATPVPLTEVQNLTAEWGDLGKQIDKVAAGAMQAIAGGMTDAVTGLIMGTKDAKQAFSEMAVSIVNDILKMIIQMTIQLALAKALGPYGAAFQGYVATVGSAHSGGEVGKTNLSRTVLPTYHSGGMATSEQAVKVERGESILTRKRAKELEMELSAQRGDRSGQKGGGGNEATIINVFDRNEIADAVVARPDAVVNAISRQLPAVRKMVMSGQRL